MLANYVIYCLWPKAWVAVGGSAWCWCQLVLVKVSRCYGSWISMDISEGVSWGRIEHIVIGQEFCRGVAIYINMKFLLYVATSKSAYSYCTEYTDWKYLIKDITLWKHFVQIPCLHSCMNSVTNVLYVNARLCMAVWVKCLTVYVDRNRRCPLGSTPSIPVENHKTHGAEKPNTKGIHKPHPPSHPYGDHRCTMI